MDDSGGLAVPWLDLLLGDDVEVAGDVLDIFERRGVAAGRDDDEDSTTAMVGRRSGEAGGARGKRWALGFEAGEKGASCRARRGTDARRVAPAMEMAPRLPWLLL